MKTTGFRMPRTLQRRALGLLNPVVFMDSPSNYYVNEENREERKKKITHYETTKIHNHLNGLEKYSLIFGVQPQRTTVHVHVPRGEVVLSHVGVWDSPHHEIYK